MIKGLERGDIVVVDLDPVVGHEQGRERPCVVLSGREFNDASVFLVVAPITSKIKGYPFEVPVHVGKLSGVVLVDHLRSIDQRARQIVRYLPKARLPYQTLMDIQSRVDALLFR